MKLRWYVAKTKWRRELRARDNLKTQGFEVFLPQFEVHTVQRRAAVTVLRPLYPNYLFVAFDRDLPFWRKITFTRGVARVMALDNQVPTPVPIGLVEALKMTGKDGKFTDPRYADAVVEPFLSGEQLLVIEGALKGTEVTFKAATTRRVLVVLHLLGDEREILLPLGSVSRA